MEMALVEIEEARGISLRRLNQGLLVRRFRSRNGSPIRVTGEQGEKIRACYFRLPRFFRNCDQDPKMATSAPAVSQIAMRNSSLPLNVYPLTK
jgi:hypothetical protein